MLGEIGALPQPFAYAGPPTEPHIRARPTGGGRVPVTARLSKRFYDALGEEIANELVNWFNQVDESYRTDLRELNELNFARFDAKLEQDRKSTRLNSSHLVISYAVFCLKKKKRVEQVRLERIGRSEHGVVASLDHPRAAGSAEQALDDDPDAQAWRRVGGVQRSAEAGAAGAQDQEIEVELIHGSGTDVDVALFLQFHHADDAPLGERLGPRRQLLERDAERLHRVAAGFETDALALELIEGALDVGVHVLGEEIAQRGAVDHELDGLDVLHATDAVDVVLDVAENEPRLAHARLVEGIDDLVLLRLLGQMGGFGGSDGGQDGGDQRDEHRVLLPSGFTLAF